MEPRFEVVILAGGECKRLYPLTTGGVVKALLPVGNRPLIWFPLRHLAGAGIKAATVVAIGEAVASRIQAYLQQQAAAIGVACKVRRRARRGGLRAAAHLSFALREGAAAAAAFPLPLLPGPAPTGRDCQRGGGHRRCAARGGAAP